MKDISSPTLFDNEKTEFEKAQKRVIKTNEWDDTLRKIKEWQEEQDRLKKRQVEDDLGNYQAYEQTQTLSNDERKELMAQNRKTEYEQKVEEIRNVLNMPDPNKQSMFSTMGAYGSNIGQQHNGLRNNRRESLLSPFLKWFQAGMLGKELTNLEVENNKQLLKNANASNNPRMRMGMGMMNSRNNVKVYESKEDQEYRMDYEDWMGFLYSYRVAGTSTILSGLMTALKIKFLFFVPSYFILIPSLAGVAYLADKLKQFSDGPLFKNITGNDSNVKLALKKRKEEKEKAKKEEENNNNSSNTRGRNRGGNSEEERRRRIAERRKRIAERRKAQAEVRNNSSDDEDDSDDLERDDMRKKSPSRNSMAKPDNADEEIDAKHTAQDKSNSTNANDYLGENNISSNVKTNMDEINRLTNELIYPKEDPNDEFELAQSKINIEDRDELYQFEDDFLNWVYLNRATFANYHEPKDILKIFAPMIVSYNKSYAKVDNIDRDSVEFKNIVCILSKSFSQMNAKFANANEHEPEFYFCIDSIERTALFYKIKLRLPQVISRNDFLKNQDVLVGTLKNDEKDVVSINTEMPNSEGYIKILRITTNSSGSGFLPLVSTGDVLRFKGMKADGTNTGVIEQLNKPNDLSLLLGLTNAEYAKIFDIAANQNANMMINGASGSGKSASSGSWFVNMLITHSPDELGIIIIDAKSGSLWENFKYAPHVLGYFGREDIKQYPAIYKVLKDVYTARQNHLNKDVLMKNFYEARKIFKKKGQWEKVLTVPRLIIIGDEQAATLSELTNIDDERTSLNKTRSKDEKEFASFTDSYNTNIMSLAVVAREGGMTIAGISQRDDAKSFPRGLMAQSQIKFIMKTPLQADADRMLDGIDCPPVNDLPTGSGYIFANGVNLSQLTTPLFSGDPNLLEEFTRMIALAWVIIQSYKEDLSREPQGYYLTQSSKDNISTFKSENIRPFNLFNRNRLYEEAKEILKTGNRVHFSPDAPQNRVHIDLDNSAHIWEPSTGRPLKEYNGRNNRVYLKNKVIDEDEGNYINNFMNANVNDSIEDIYSSKVVDDKNDDNLSNANEVKDNIVTANNEEKSKNDILDYKDSSNEYDNEDIKENYDEDEQLVDKDKAQEILGGLFLGNTQDNLSSANSSEDNESKEELDDKLDEGAAKEELKANNSNENESNKLRTNELNVNTPHNELESNKTINEPNKELNTNETNINNTSMDELNIDKPNMSKSNISKPHNDFGGELNAEISHQDNKAASSKEINDDNNSIPSTPKHINKITSIDELALKVVKTKPNEDNSNNEVKTTNNKVLSSPKQSNHIIKKEAQNKDTLTVTDLRDYFIKNDIHSMSLSDISNMFNQETITMAINKGIISLDIKTNKVTLL